MIGAPGSLPLARLEELGVARVSYGPWSQRVALTALQDLVRDVHAGGGHPRGHARPELRRTLEAFRLASLAQRPGCSELLGFHRRSTPGTQPVTRVSAPVLRSSSHARSRQPRA